MEPARSQPKRSENLLNAVFGRRGYCDDIRLRPDELARLQQMTRDSWLAVIHKVAPDQVAPFERIDIDEYHRLAHLIDHARIWTTGARTYSAEIVDAIRSFSLFDRFERECPGYRIASAMPPYGDLGRARMNWRLVRPGHETDIGPIHADYWFEAVMDGWSPQPTDEVRIKIWIAICLEPGVTGFAYVPGSHLDRLPFERKRLPDGAVKPSFDEASLPTPLQVLPTPSGTAVVFNYNLVHRGANSERATRTRVSMETTLEVPRRQLERVCGDLSAYY